MTQLPIFSESTANLGMPMLFAGQAQKEFMINKALSILDSLAPTTVAASLPSPPIEWAEGNAYRVTANASDDWEGKEDMIAIAVAGSWHFVAPSPGMQVFDQMADCMLHYRFDWRSVIEPLAPVGGAVVDEQAREAILEIIEALRAVGLCQSNE